MTHTLKSTPFLPSWADVSDFPRFFLSSFSLSFLSLPPVTSCLIYMSCLLGLLIQFTLDIFLTYQLWLHCKLAHLSICIYITKSLSYFKNRRFFKLKTIKDPTHSTWNFCLWRNRQEATHFCKQYFHTSPRQFRQQPRITHAESTEPHSIDVHK